MFEFKPGDKINDSWCRENGVVLATITTTRSDAAGTRAHHQYEILWEKEGATSYTAEVIHRVCEEGHRDWTELTYDQEPELNPDR